jgi:hypothetical protein
MMMNRYVIATLFIWCFYYNRIDFVNIDFYYNNLIEFTLFYRIYNIN